MKALIVASVASMIDQFNMNNIRILKELGYEVHVACNFVYPGSITKEKTVLLKIKLKDLDVKFYQIDFSRNIFSIFKHFKAKKQLSTIFKENTYRIVHCHSPIGGLITRVVAKKYRKKGTFVIYTAHGFHFYKGAPKKNWIMFYPLEKMCSKWTDLIITINKEDYELAKNKMRANVVEYVPGVGINVDSIASIKVDVAKKRQEIGVPVDSKMVFSVGELNTNKNHQLVIKALGIIKDPSIHYVIAGLGELKDELIALANECHVNLHLLGFRTDVYELYKCADLFVLPSIREGLNVSTMEAIAAGCRTIVSRIRGNIDMVPIENCFDPHSVDELVELLKKDVAPNSDFMKIANSNNVDKKMRTLYQGFNS